MRRRLGSCRVAIAATNVSRAIPRHCQNTNAKTGMPSVMAIRFSEKVMENVTAANRSIANGNRCALFTFISFIITTDPALLHHEWGDEYYTSFDTERKSGQLKSARIHKFFGSFFLGALGRQQLKIQINFLHERITALLCFTFSSPLVWYGRGAEFAKVPRQLCQQYVG